jgi:hypothetical protein
MLWVLISGSKYCTQVSSAVTIRSKNWRGAKLVKDATQILFSVIIKQLVKRWNRCVEVEGDYVEKKH